MSDTQESVWEPDREERVRSSLSLTSFSLDWGKLLPGAISAIIGNNSSADFAKSWKDKLKEDFPPRRPTLRHVSGNFSLSDQTHAIISQKNLFYKASSQVYGFKLKEKFPF